MSRRPWTLGEPGLLVEHGNCRGNAATIIVDTQPHHPWAEQTARGPRFLSANGDTGAVVEPPVTKKSHAGVTNCTPRLLTVESHSRTPTDGVTKTGERHANYRNLDP
jgi:hypothetical protein